MNNLRLIQKIIKFFTSESKFEAMKRESLQWQFTCSCGKTTSIWDLGGIRFKAKGNSKKGLPCPYCNKFDMRMLIKREN